MAIYGKLSQMSDELNFPISISKLPPASETLILPVNQKVLKRVAEECDVLEFNKLEAKFRFKRWRKHGLTVLCDFRAEIQQECIATLEPVSSSLNESIERQFLPERSSDYKAPEIIDGEMILDPEANDLPDILETDQINLWDILIEELLLVIDLFPRAEAIEQDTQAIVEASDKPSGQTNKPFSDLKSLITNKKNNN